MTRTEARQAAQQWANGTPTHADTMDQIVEHVRSLLRSMRADAAAGLVSRGRGLLVTDVAQALGIRRDNADALVQLADQQAA